MVQLLQAALKTAQAGGNGVLVGFGDGSELTVLAAYACAPDDLETAKVDLEALLPPPLVVLGTFWPGAAARQFSWARVVVADGKVLQAGAVVQPQVHAAAPADFLAAHFVPVRLAADHVLEVGGSDAAALRSAFADLTHRLCGSTSVYLAALGGSSSSAAAGAAPQHLPGRQSFGSLGGSWSSPVTLAPFQLSACSSGASSADGGYRAPVAVLQPCSGGVAQVRSSPLHLDVLCYAAKDHPAGQVVEQLVRPAVQRQLEALQSEATAAGAGGAPAPPLRALHFLPPGLGHHITLIYPLPTPCSEAQEAALEGRRRRLHALLGLPPNRPLLRTAAALALDGGSGGAAGSGAAPAGGAGSSGRLSDVHVGLPPSGVGGSVHLVQGSYDYYHYMQDKFDDNGWGCAYRSLQTIWSWYQRQQLTSRPPPGHREMQRALVEASQRPPSFLGSREWIGALELGCLVEGLLHGGGSGAAYRVLNVASGADIPSLARELAHHFDTHGSPIMIGGGVLAYTLLGIDYNERTGDCAFLILDPHYTGADDLKKIRAGGWVAWRKMGDKSAGGSELFRADSFYNFMCPIPSSGV